MTTQNDTVQKIVAVLKEHYVHYDGFSQDDSWQCNCNRDDKKASGYQFHYGTRAEVEQHIARRIEMAVAERAVIAQQGQGQTPFWAANE